MVFTKTKNEPRFIEISFEFLKQHNLRQVSGINVILDKKVTLL